jgi:myo-inositol-hexaphosphate 3-phosphohydrolase
MRCFCPARRLALFPCLALFALASLALAQATVLPVAETDPARSPGDSADDAVVWIHPTDRTLSTVIGTDKLEGLSVFDLSGHELQFLPDGHINNVDLRYGFPLRGLRVTLVTASVRVENRLAIYAVDPNTRRLHDVAARPITLGLAAYGCCMYRSARTGDTYFFVNSKAGEVEQWRLFDDGNGRVDAEQVRSFDVGIGEVEGCVADDPAGNFFIAEEDVGIWRYGAEPDAGEARVQVDRTGSGGHLTADVEGLTLFYADATTGYLLASSQGDNTYAVYDRTPPHAYRFSFRIGDNTALGVDGTTSTDGIDVTNLDLGGAFGSGLFVAQDNTNPGANQNFKLVPWSSIANAAVPPLRLAPTYDPSGALSPSAVAHTRNGSGANPRILINRSRPVLGTTWGSDLDCSGHAPGAASLVGYSRPSSGTSVAAGEILVDLTSPQLFFVTTSHAGDTVPFRLPVPHNLALCGLTLSVQGLCSGAPATRFSNALDLTLGQ